MDPVTLWRWHDGDCAFGAAWSQHAREDAPTPAQVNVHDTRVYRALPAAEFDALLGLLREARPSVAHDACCPSGGNEAALLDLERRIGAMLAASQFPR